MARESRTIFHICLAMSFFCKKLSNDKILIMRFIYKAMFSQKKILFYVAYNFVRSLNVTITKKIIVMLSFLSLLCLVKSKEVFHNGAIKKSKTN